MIGKKQTTGHMWSPPAGHDYSQVPVIQYQDGTYGCARPPRGWECTREPAHEGPCAAIQVINTKPQYVPGCDTPEKQQAAVDAWRKEHDKKHTPPGQKHRYAGAIGGAYTWETTGTSLGTVVVVRCTCGEAIDVSDYDGW